LGWVEFANPCNSSAAENQPEACHNFGKKLTGRIYKQAAKPLWMWVQIKAGNQGLVRDAWIAPARVIVGAEAPANDFIKI